jgi:hypothetical protein
MSRLDRIFVSKEKWRIVKIIEAVAQCTEMIRLVKPGCSFVRDILSENNFYPGWNDVRIYQAVDTDHKVLHTYNGLTRCIVLEDSRGYLALMINRGVELQFFDGESKIIQTIDKVDTFFVDNVYTN